MVDRICISINNRCNLACKYCHFREKKASIAEDHMDVFKILDNVVDSIEKNDIKAFKIGFVGNGEPLLDFDLLNTYLLYSRSPRKWKNRSIYHFKRPAA